MGVITKNIDRARAYINHLIDCPSRLGRFAGHTLGWMALGKIDVCRNCSWQQLSINLEMPVLPW